MTQNMWLRPYHPVWTSPSANSQESMPCGGGDIGLNVWVEKGDLLVYMARSGTFDENNGMPKAGRIRVTLSPNPLNGANFRQELNLQDGSVTIDAEQNGLKVSIKVWADALKPVAHIDITSNKGTTATASYETWRYADLSLRKRESNANSYKWAAPDTLKTYADTIRFASNGVLFYHRNRKKTVFDVTVAQQGLDSLRSQLYNPLAELTFGGMMTGSGMTPDGTNTGTYASTPYKAFKLKSRQPAKTHHLTVTLHKSQSGSMDDWTDQLNRIHSAALTTADNDSKLTRKWWQDFWQRSYIIIDPEQKLTDPSPWQAGRNYQLFRHMLGCNAKGDYPTKFNGGLFTVDPCYTDSALSFTPDFRNWGGGTFTAQNQRLVYWPMLKSGDVDLMKPQFDFYLRLLKNAELRSRVYWGHNGACFTEQMENFALPNPSEYGWKRPKGFDKGLEYNAWLEYEWDTVLEFCQMMLETYRYNQNDITNYLPFVESCLTFFDEHYQYLASQRGRKALDADGHLVLYPGSACETYKMAYNSASTIAALQTVAQTLLTLPDNILSAGKKAHWQAFRQRIPPIPYRQTDGKTTIAPAQLWERTNNVETPQLYPVFPWGIYGVGKPGLDTAINTYRYDADALKFRSHIGWKQDNIWAARLGLTDEAKTLLLKKLGNAPQRYPVFWGPGFDWLPDHNWGGSGMIGLQEMLLQTAGDDILLFPAWPMEWDVHFKLHAPGQTTVEVVLKDGKIEMLEVWPKARMGNIKIMNVQ